MAAGAVMWPRAWSAARRERHHATERGPEVEAARLEGRVVARRVESIVSADVGAHSASGAAGAEPRRAVACRVQLGSGPEVAL